MRILKATSSIDGWRSMILEMNGQRRDLQIDFPNEDHQRKFSGIIERMKRPPEIESKVNTVTITFNKNCHETSKYNHSRSKIKVPPVTTVAPTGAEKP